VTTEERLAAIEQKLDRVLALLEPKPAAPAPAPEPAPARSGSKPSGEPDANGVIWTKSFTNCNWCKAECRWAFNTKTQRWRTYEPTAPFDAHNCKKRAKQDDAGDLLPGAAANDPTRAKPEPGTLPGHSGW
jgi:hypothetical protein